MRVTPKINTTIASSTKAQNNTRADPAMPFTMIRRSLQKRTTRSKRRTLTRRIMRSKRNWESSISMPSNTINSSAVEMATKNVSVAFQPNSGFSHAKNIRPSATIRSDSSSKKATTQVMSKTRNTTPVSAWMFCMAKCVSSPKVADDRRSVIITKSSKYEFRTTRKQMNLYHGSSDSSRWYDVTDLANLMGVPGLRAFDRFVCLEKDTRNFAGDSSDASAISTFLDWLLWLDFLVGSAATALCRRPLLASGGPGAPERDAETGSETGTRTSSEATMPG
mmetsp:Transcript_39799/g.92088  ORF Transcript_39799/g.92088 Transcript_39799/m.92088 type:complete len:278 (-) Transcript_39799:339-1172(-)